MTVLDAPRAPGRRGASLRPRNRLGVDPRHVDWMLVGALVGIAVLGLVMVYSSTRHRFPGDPSYFLKRQAITLVLGVGVFALLLAVDYRKLRDFSLLAYLAVVGMLVLVLSPLGSSAKGAQAWFQLPGGFQFQPSEVAKFLLIVALAGYVNEHRGDIDPWRLTVVIGLALVPLVLVQLQPDLGTNLVLVVIVIGLLAIAGVRARYLAVLALLGLTFVFAIVNLGILKQYQIDRLASVVDPQRDPQGSAYNQDQSKKTIANGGIMGRGLFEGPQTRLGFVPEQHTDFIFTAVGEELGFLGASTLLALFAIVLWRTWRAAQLARDYFGTLVCGGVLAMFAFMVFENIGMTLGIMPVAGIPLPFMSYGGSALVTCCACMALVVNVHARRFS